MGNPKILNLDDLETSASEVTIKHEGVEHHMRVLDVEAFIAQQKRAARHQKMAAEAESVGDNEVASVVELIAESVKEFFPTLPVNNLPTPKLFMIFAWLNQMSNELNQIEAPESGEGVSTVSAEGKGQPQN